MDSPFNEVTKQLKKEKEDRAALVKSVLSYLFFQVRSQSDGLHLETGRRYSEKGMKITNNSPLL